MDLKIIASEIRDILENKRKRISLTFEEDEHVYTMKDLDGELKTNFPSVSTVIKYFHDEFDSEAKSFQKARGNLEAQQKLLEEWKYSADYASNTGSRVHFELESYLISLYDNYKEVRQPIFECNETQIRVGDMMIKAGKDFIELMHKRGSVLLDTETVLGSAELGYTGQPDKIWLFDNKGELGFIVTDWKSNKPKNFEVQWFTNMMYEPFEYLHNTALGHYNLQLPLYTKLFLNMLRGSKYEDIKFLGGIIVLLKDDATYEEYRIPKKVSQKILDMDIKQYMLESKKEVI